ncbi:PREDICTED: zinc finger protein 831 isoform X2 [Calidris pugnax]|uniref:zinc finger protein 831 isoform X2 n=1 Tax=Calidris pugnax TaxID=198806 RepID=UPI00071D911C|nr:PREDICTED: zinc finger protein 831 isoform X2 [Calidris pugnax]
MEAQDQPGFTAALADGPVPASSLQPAPGPGSAAPRQDPAPSQPLYLKALTVPLYQPLQAGCWQPRGPLVAGRSCVHLESSNVPLILNPLLPSEGTDQPHSLFPKQLGQTLTLNIVSTLPVLSSPNSGVNASTGSPGKSKKAGKYVCKHCGRDCLKPSVLEKHIRSHTGERPFPCTTCGIAFKTQSNLYKHRRTQTHVNNTRAPSDSDSSAASEQNEKSTESIASHQGSKLLGGTSEDKGVQVEQGSSETSADTKRLPNDLPPPATGNPSCASENQETTNPSSSSKANQGVPEREPESLSSPGALLNGQCQRKKVREQRTPSTNKHIQLQRQQATSWDKQWDAKAFECKLKKCESTDSGYLSRSDSVELASPGPLQGLCPPGAEPESQPGLRSPAKPEPAQRATASMLEKKRLEEHISKLISHNKSVVDDTQLDNVRPRKTVLSKQGSIDLPMPYTYKDSFHFDIRTCDGNRKKNLSLCSAKSTFAPLEKCKPVFFHSVPTQFSTTIDAVPVTRSNSLPVAEGSGARDRAGGSQTPSLGRPPPNIPHAAALLPGNNPPADSLDFPSSHPRALVRQAAVDSAAEHPPPPEELGAGARTAARNKKHNPRKLKMFSHEKWQMYGDETFKKIYQKMKSSQSAKKIKQRGNKITDITSFTPDSKESVSSTEIPEHRDGRSSASNSLPFLLTTGLNLGKSETCTNSNHTVQNLCPEATADSLTCAMETSHPGNAPAQTVTSRTSPELGDSDTDKRRGDNSVSPAPTSCELGLKNPRCQLNASGRNDDRLPAQSREWGKPSPGKESSAFESEHKSTSNTDGSHSGSEGTSQPVPTPPGTHCNSTREAAGKSQNLPSERKKLKFEVEKAPNVIAKSCPCPSTESQVGNAAERVRCSSAQCVSTAPLMLSGKAEEQKLSTGINESTGGTGQVEYMKTIKLPTKALNYGDVNPLSHSAGISKASFVGFLGPEFRGSDCNSSALHNATDTDVKTCLVKTGAKAPVFGDNAVDVSSKIHHLQSGHLTPIPQQNAFPPKYILTLPQGKRASDLSLLLQPEEKVPPCTPVTHTSATPPCSATSRVLSSHPDDVARSPAKPEVRQKATSRELQWSTDASWKTPVVCSPVCSETTNPLTPADNTFNNQNFRQQDIIRDAWKNKRNKNELNYQRQAEEKWMSIAASSTQTPQKKIGFPSVYTSGFLVSADVKEERKVLHGPCSGRDSLTGTSVSSGAVEPAVPGWDRGGSPCVPSAPSPALQDTLRSRRGADSPPSCSHPFGTRYCPVPSTPCKAFPTPARSTPTCCSGASTAPTTKGTFPSLNAEPQLTWCCLTRSLPLPAQQPGEADSARSPLHPRHEAAGSERTLSKDNISIFKMKNISGTVAYGLTNRSLNTLVPSFSKGQQTQELNSAAPDGAFRNTSEQRKKTVVCKKEKLSTNKLKRSHKQKKIKVTPKWYRGRLAHGHAQLKMNGLSKWHCFPNRALDAWRKGSLSRPCRVNKKCHSPQSKVQENSLHQQQATSRSTSDKPPCRRKKEGKNNSGISSHTENLNHVKQKHKIDKKNITAPLEIPVPAHPLSAPVSAASSERGICCSGTLQPSLPEGSQPNIPRDSMAPAWPCPSDFTNTGRGDQPGSTAPETTESLHLEGSQENTLNVEPEGQRSGTLEPLTQVLGREKPPGEAKPHPSPKDTSTPSSQPGRSHLFGSNTESATGAELPSMEHTKRPNFSQPTLDLQGSTDGKGAPRQEKSHGQPPATATAAFTQPPVTLRSPECEIYSATPAKTYKKRGLEMMRKQSRVEYDDTSSDDEDRLVIEI